MCLRSHFTNISFINVFVPYGDTFLSKVSIRGIARHGNMLAVNFIDEYDIGSHLVIVLARERHPFYRERAIRTSHIE